jgi:hypothetical protein
MSLLTAHPWVDAEIWLSESPLSDHPEIGPQNKCHRRLDCREESHKRVAQISQDIQSQIPSNKVHPIDAAGVGTDHDQICSWSWY